MPPRKRGAGTERNIKRASPRPPTLVHPIIIAIDGPAAAGKGTLARRVAAAFNLPHLDTGLLYRAVARRVLNQSQGRAGGGGHGTRTQLSPPPAR